MKWRWHMDSLMDNLTTTEAAVAAGGSLPQINRVIDDRILPDDWYSTSPTRTVRTDACLLISFYFETADLLTAGARLQTIRNAVAHDHTWEEWKNYSSEGHFLTVRFADLWQKVDRRLRHSEGGRKDGGRRPGDFRRYARDPRHPRAGTYGCCAVRHGYPNRPHPEVLSKPD